MRPDITGAIGKSLMFVGILTMMFFLSGRGGGTAFAEYFVEGFPWWGAVVGVGVGWILFSIGAIVG